MQNLPACSSVATNVPGFWNMPDGCQRLTRSRLEQKSLRKEESTHQVKSDVMSLLTDAAVCRQSGALSQILAATSCELRAEVEGKKSSKVLVLGGNGAVDFDANIVAGAARTNSISARWIDELRCGGSLCRSCRCSKGCGVGAHAADRCGCARGASLNCLAFVGHGLLPCLGQVICRNLSADQVGWLQHDTCCAWPLIYLSFAARSLAVRCVWNLSQSAGIWSSWTGGMGWACSVGLLKIWQHAE